MRESIIKCSNWDKEGFLFMSYVYLHGEAETINSYDCMEGNIYAFKDLMKGCLSIVDLLMQDGTKLDALMIPCYSETRMQGLVCLCSDIQSIKDALTGYYSKLGIQSLSIYEHDKEFLKEKYPDTFNLINEIRKK